MELTRIQVLLAVTAVCVIVIAASIWMTASRSAVKEPTADAESSVTPALTETPQGLAVVDPVSIDSASEPSSVDAEAGRRTERSASTVNRVLSRGRLRVGVAENSAPLSFIGEDGQYTGFEVDIAQALAERWLGDATALELVPIVAVEADRRLAAGDVDIVIASVIHARDLDSSMDFSQTYLVSPQDLLVPATSTVTDLKDLHTETIAVVEGSTLLDALHEQAQQDGIKLGIRQFYDYRSGGDALLTGEIAALAGDRHVLANLASTQGDLRLASIPFGHAAYGIGVAHGDSYLREMVNYTLQDMKADGEYDALHGRWFPETEPYAVEVSLGFWPYSFASLPTELGRETEPTIQRILERGTVVAGIGVDQPPFGARADDGQVVGFDPAIVREFARRWLGDQNAVEFVTGDLDDQITRLAAGEIDLVAAAIANERDWADLIDFSQTYVGPPAVDSPVKIGVKQRDTSFRELVDFTLQEMQQDGVYADLFVYWLGAGTPLYALEVLPGQANYLPVAFNADSQPSQNLPLASQPAQNVALVSQPAQDLSAVSSPTESLDAANSTVGRIRARGNRMIAGVKYDFNPFGFLDESGAVAGFDVDLIQALADSWGIEVEFAPVTSGNRIEKLAADEVDMVAASMTHTKGRDASIDFSQTYFADGQSLLVRRESGINDIVDLAGGRVAAIEGSTSIIQINDHAAAHGVEIEIAPFQVYPSAVEALIAGQVDAVTTDSVALQRFARDNPELHVVGDLFTHEPYGFGLKAGDATFANLVNFSLQALKESGAYDELYYKWFGDNATPYPVEILPGTWPYTIGNAPGALDEPDESRVQHIVQTGLLSVGIAPDLAPSSFQDESGNLAGFDIDLSRELAKRWLGDENAIAFVPVSGRNSVDLLDAGAVDLVAALLRHERVSSEAFSFSQTYHRGPLSLLAQRDSGIRAETDPFGLTVGILVSSAATNNEATTLLLADSQMPVVPFSNAEAALEALETSQIDALAVNAASAAQLTLENAGLEVVARQLSTEPYTIGLPKYDHRFRDLVNFTLQEMQVDGTYERLHEKWFGTEEPFAVEIWPGQSYLTTSVTPMVRIPEAAFVRGSDKGLPDEQPQRTITVDEFYIDQFEVTNRLYDLCVRAGACGLPQFSRSLANGLYYADPVFHNFPIIWVSWNDAGDYCTFVGKRLPTEAEWEKASRGISDIQYPWGNDTPSDQANFGYSLGDVARIGEYQQDRSPYGVNDMAGNVREWVSDWYRWDDYNVAPDANPTGPEEGTTRVVRGGSWDDDALSLRVSARRNFLPESADANLGFRCASSSPPSR